MSTDRRHGDSPHVQTQAVAGVDVVVHHRRQQVVGDADSMKVTGEMQVDVFHRQDLRVTAASSAAFHAKARAQTRLAQDR